MECAASSIIDFLTEERYQEKKYSLDFEPGISLYGCAGFARGIRETTEKKKRTRRLRTEFQVHEKGYDEHIAPPTFHASQLMRTTA
jgi:hypothetical protein